MEYLPPQLPSERLPDEDSPKKRSRWNVFELFKKRDGGEPEEYKRPEETKPEKAIEKPKDNPDRLRNLAQKFMKLIGSETKTEQTKDITNARPETAYETATEKPPTIVERAKQIGRNVLGLIKQTRGEVQQADTQERVQTPTNTEPLETADQNVRSAMEELLAPIDEFVAERTTPISETDEITDAGSDSAAMPLAGVERYDYDGLSPETVQAQHNHEIAAGTAAASREAMRTTERLEKRQGQVRKLGVVAAVGALVYTWHRQKEIIKEQRREKRKLKKFEAVVRQEQEVAATKISELERAQIASMSQPARQEYVHEVSQFATRQAEEIRSVARAQHPETDQRLRLQHKLEPIIAGPGRETQPIPVPGVESSQKLAAKERFTTGQMPEKAPLNPAVAAHAERPGLIERVTGVISGKTRQVQEGGGVGGTGGSMPVSNLRNIITGEQTTPTTQKTAPQTATATSAILKNRSGPTWLLGTLLAIAVIVVLMFLTGVL